MSVVSSFLKAGVMSVSFRFSGKSLLIIVSFTILSKVAAQES